MSYYNDLSYELRNRGLSEARISSVLKEVQQHCELSGESPDDAFGKPGVYAENIPAEGRPRTSRWLMNIGGLLVLLIFAVQIVGLALGHDMRLGPVPFFALGLPILFAFIIAAFIKSRRVPRKSGLK